MRKYILLLISVLLLSCNNDEFDSLFSENVDQRISERINNYNEILKTPEFGWKLVYFPNPTEMGGYTHLMKFSKTNEVEIFSEKDIRGVSSYSINFSEEIILNFELNSVLTEFSEPSSSRPNGLGGDVEFYIKSATADKVVLKGRKLGSDAILIPALKDEWINLVASCAKMESNLEQIKPAQLKEDQWFINKIKGANSLSIDISFCKASRTVELGYHDGNDVKKDIQGISFTKNGFHLSKPLKVNGSVIEDFVYNETAKQFNLVGDKTISIESYVDAYPEYNYGKEVVALLSLTDNKDPKYASKSFFSAKESVKSLIGGNIDMGVQLYNSPDSTKISFMCLDPIEWWTDPAWHDIYAKSVSVNTDNSITFEKYSDSNLQYKNNPISKNISEDPKGQILLNMIFNNKGWYIYKALTLQTFAGKSTGYLFISKDNPKDWFYMFSES